jgi:uncharacterized membrane protein YciS (DUF1049 family)
MCLFVRLQLGHKVSSFLHIVFKTGELIPKMICMPFSWNILQVSHVIQTQNMKQVNHKTIPINLSYNTKYC